MTEVADLERELLAEVGKVVAIVAYVHDGRVLVIRRPESEEWEPSKYSPPVGHIEESDVRCFLEGVTKGVWSDKKENLYFLAAGRELTEEVSREPCQMSLNYIGDYHDDETGYDVVVVSGVLTLPLREGLNFNFNIPRVRPTAEASVVKLYTPRWVRTLERNGSLVGFRAYKTAFEYMGN